MTNCPACGLIRGQHNSILQGCTCQFQMMGTRVTFPEIREWKGLTDEEIEDFWEANTGHSIFGGDKAEGRTMYLSPDEVEDFARAIEAKLKQKNGYAEEKNT